MALTQCQKEAKECGHDVPEVDKFCPKCDNQGLYGKITNHPMASRSYCRDPYSGTIIDELYTDRSSQTILECPDMIVTQDELKQFHVARTESIPIKEGGRTYYSTLSRVALPITQPGQLLMRHWLTDGRILLTVGAPVPTTPQTKYSFLLTEMQRKQLYSK